VNDDSSPNGSRREQAILRLWEAYNLLGDEDDFIRTLVQLALLELARRRSGEARSNEDGREPDDK
jgi:hypothetical protein